MKESDTNAQVHQAKPKLKLTSPKSKASSRSQSTLENYLAIPALALTIVLLTFTEIPIPLVLLLPFLLIIAIPQFTENNWQWIFAVFALTAYDCLVGSIFVLSTGNGEVKIAVYHSLRAFAVSIIVLLALWKASIKTIYFVIFSWAVLQLCALFAETHGLDSASLLPFRIYSVNLTQAIINSPVGERHRGFTAESGILGGMASLFLVLVVLSNYLRMRIHKLKAMELLGLAITVIPLIVILGLTYTKSGVFLLVTSILVLTAHAALTQDWRSVFASIKIFLFTGASLFLLIFISPSAQEYIEQERVTLMTSFQNKGIQQIEGTGFGTRLAGIELTILGMFDYPFGLGYEGLATFVTKNIDKVETSTEMEELSIDVWGPKNYALDILCWDGIPGLALLIWIIFLTVKPYVCASRFGFFSMRITLLASIFSLGLATEMLPFIAICALILSAGLALQRELQAEMKLV